MRTLSSRPLLSCALVSAIGCGDDADPNCYPLDPMLEFTAPSIPLCEYRSSEIPPPPAGYANRYRVGAAFTPTDENPCDPCDREHFDALLKAQIQQDLVSECDEPYADFEGLCYSPPSETQDYCSVLGMYASNCEQREGG